MAKASTELKIFIGGERVVDESVIPLWHKDKIESGSITPATFGGRFFKEDLSEAIFVDEYQFPKGITIQAEKNLITVSGIDKQLVGQVSAKIRSFKKPEPYKGKGIKYLDEVIRRKAGKVVKGGE